MSIGSSNPGIVAKVAAGTNVTVTGTPTNPIINSTGGGGSGTVTSVSATAPATVSNPTTTPNIVVPVMVASGASHAAGLVPDPGVTGGVTKFLREDATFAVPSGGGGSGALTQIQQIITSASQASVTFSAIPGTFTNLILRYIGRSLSVTAADDLKMQLNGDTGNNYTTQATVSIGAAVSGIPVISASAFVIGTLTASTSTAGMSGGGSLIIPGYAQTLFNKTGSGLMSYAQISSNLTSFISGLQWANTTAITSIKLFPNLGSGFLNGSIFTLYGEQ